MIDGLVVRYSRRKDKPTDPTYRPQDAIVSSKVLNSSANRLAVIFPGWHTHNFPINILAKRLARRGWAVLVYDFNDQIIEPDDETVKNSFKFIRDSISLELNRLRSAHHYEHIHFVGISLGNVPLALVADIFPGFHSATLVAAGDDLAIDLWHGLRTSYLAPMFQRMKIGVTKLDQDWHMLAPANHAIHFKDKPVVFILALRDKFILTKYQKKMAERLMQSGSDLKIKKRWAGHVVTITRYCLFDRPL